MSEQPEKARDTKFAGFAKLLVHDLVTAGFDEIGYRSAGTTQKIIAQRAYDLAGHVIDHLNSYAYDTAIPGARLWDWIPDMTEWPKNEGE